MAGIGSWSPGKPLLVPNSASYVRSAPKIGPVLWVTENNNPADGGKSALHLDQVVEIIGMNHQQRRLGVVDHRGHLRWGQPPVDSNIHRSHEGSAKQQVEIGQSVAVEQGDTVRRSHSLLQKGLSNLA